MVNPLTITKGEAISLLCEIDSQPQSHVYWEKDGIAVNRIITSTRVVESNISMTRIQSNLSINYGNKSNEGLYKCVAVNSMGNLTQNVYVYVNCKSFSSHLTIFYVSIIKSLSFQRL